MLEPLLPVLLKTWYILFYSPDKLLSRSLPFFAVFLLPARNVGDTDTSFLLRFSTVFEYIYVNVLMAFDHTQDN